MKKKYIVTLTKEERRMLQDMLSRGKAAARKLLHARILLKADATRGSPGWNDETIAEGLDVGRATIWWLWRARSPLKVEAAGR
jgi:hypothetical protein